MPILIYRYNIIIKNDVQLYTLFKPTFFNPLYLTPFHYAHRHGHEKTQVQNNDELLDVWKHNKSNKREKRRGENGKGKGDFAKFEINKGITLILLIDNNMYPICLN